MCRRDCHEVETFSSLQDDEADDDQTCWSNGCSLTGLVMARASMKLKLKVKKRRRRQTALKGQM